jgi:hypothetical protein
MQNQNSNPKTPNAKRQTPKRTFNVQRSTSNIQLEPKSSGRTLLLVSGVERSTLNVGR